MPNRRRRQGQSGGLGLFFIVAIVVVGALLVQFWYIVVSIGVIALAVIYVPVLIRYVRMKRYFNSEEFIAQKKAIASVVQEHNEVAAYTAELRSNNSFRLGASMTGAQADLASFVNTSRWGYVRDRNVADYAAPNVHNCSLQIVRNAAADPLRYVIRYFRIEATESTVEDVETLGEQVSRLENAVSNLAEREHTIAGSIDPPSFILEYYSNELMAQVGVELSPIQVPYPEYRFEYVSAGGNSSQHTSVELKIPVIDALVETLSQKIRFAASAAGQRALMTAKLREHIKVRDNHTCQSCAVSVVTEPHLLLEVDHIVPVSRGGLSTVENLQTLCWRCNRTKSNKVSSPVQRVRLD